MAVDVSTEISSLLAPFMAISMRRANQKDLARLKELLERRPAGG